MFSSGKKSEDLSPTLRKRCLQPPAQQCVNRRSLTSFGNRVQTPVISRSGCQLRRRDACSSLHRKLPDTAPPMPFSSPRADARSLLDVGEQVVGSKYLRFYHVHRGIKRSCQTSLPQQYAPESSPWFQISSFQQNAQETHTTHTYDPFRSLMSDVCIKALP